MPVIEIEATRIVTYSKNVEVTEEQATRYSQAINNRNKEEVQQCLDSWIDPRYDVLDAERYELVNTSIDDQPLDF